MKKIFLLSIIPAVMLFSCGGGNEFRVDGIVENGEDETLLLERSVNGVWLRLDSIKTNGSGKFSFSQEAPAHPEIYRLERNGKFIYFPIDSLDHVVVKTDTANFGTGYSLSGSDNAVWMMQVDSVARVLASNPSDDALYAKAKADFATQILLDPSSIVAYYTVNKLIGNRPLYSIDNRNDVRIIGAVANAYATKKPDDPRTEYLKNMFFSGRRMTVRNTAPTDTIYADQSQILEIELFDENGNVRKLSEAASNGKVVLLNFTTYLADESPALNAQLAELYRKYAASGLEIFQVGYDENEFSWKNGARNLPWVTVYDPSGVQSQNLVRYNIGALPAMFVINRQGELSERVVALGNLEKIIKKYL